MNLQPSIREAIVVAESMDAVEFYHWLTSHGLGDGYPVIRPTRRRLDDIIGPLDADEHVGNVPPLAAPASIADVAACSLMAGGGPDDLLLVLTAIRAALNPDFNLLGVATTTGNVAITVILHGPCIKRVHANSGSNCFGPGARPNATIGRSVSLALRWLGGAASGITDMATIGQPAKYGACLAEGSAPPGWMGLHEERGIPSGHSAVTVFAATNITEVNEATATSPEDLLATLANAIPRTEALRSDGMVLTGGEHLLVLPPDWAALLNSNGWDKQAVRRYLVEQTAVEPSRLPPTLRRRLPESVEAGRVPSVLRDADFLIMVAGGPGWKAAHLTSWPGGARSQTIAAPVGQ